MPNGEGHRFFASLDREGIYVCDNSGPDPDRSDDGPLLVLAKEGLVWDPIKNRIDCTVYVERREESSRVCLTPEDAAWLASRMLLTVVLTPGERAIERFNALGTLIDLTRGKEIG